MGAQPGQQVLADAVPLLGAEGIDGGPVARHTGGEEHPEDADHRIEAAVGQPGAGRVAGPELDVGQPFVRRPGPGQLSSGAATSMPSTRPAGPTARQ